MIWQTQYFKWNGNGWVSDSTAFEEIDGKEVFIRELQPDLPFANIVAQEREWAQETLEAKHKAD